MELYVGIKQIYAVPMNKDDWVLYITNGLQKLMNGEENEAGYLVEYIDGGKPNHPNHEGYISWSPNEVFEKAYTLTTNMTFDKALYLLKEGSTVRRSGWEDETKILKFIESINEISVLTNDNVNIPWWVAWEPSNVDLVANDWVMIVPNIE